MTQTMWLRCLAGVLLACAVAGTAVAERLALVIGNDSYRFIKPLRNAKADAEAVAVVLKRAGFDVTLELDLDRVRMNSAVRKFRARVAGGDEIVFFFAGHGVESDGNFLLPVDTMDHPDYEVADQGMQLTRVLKEFAGQRPRIAIAIIDACRDNPLEGTGRNSNTRGLVPTSGARGQLVVYSAGSGERALDRLSIADKSPNGLFTRVLLENIQKPGLSIRQQVAAVREQVVRLAQSVDHVQTPALYDQALGEFYLFPPTAGNPVQGDGAAFDAAKTADTLQAYEAYLEAFPSGGFTAAARIRIAALKSAAMPVAPDPEEVLWSEAKRRDAREAYERYLQRFPNGRFRAPATSAIERLGPKAGSPVQWEDGKGVKECPVCPEMVAIPAGDVDVPWRQASVRVARVAVGKFEVTQGEWKALMGTNPSYFSDCGDACPVEQVSWDDAREFIRKLNQRVVSRDAGPYRLLSEAEWVHACLGGERREYCGGDTLDDLAWYTDNSERRTRPVGSKRANRFGLHDMSGNVWEWVQDCWNDESRFTTGAVDDRRPATVCAVRAVRGGAWLGKPADVRATRRYGTRPAHRADFLGFRVARALP